MTRLQLCWRRNLCRQKQFKLKGELLWELILIEFFPFRFVCIKSLSQGIYLYRSLKRGIYTAKFLIDSYQFNSLASLFPAKLPSPPRTFSLLNTQDGCTLNNKREGVNHEITHDNYTITLTIASIIDFRLVCFNLINHSVREFQHQANFFP